MQPNNQKTIGVFEDDGGKFGLIVGETHHIITEPDFCHSVFPNVDTAEFLAQKEMASATPVRITAFGHYFGIKTRVRDNYDLLIQSMREIGLDASDMPEWSTEARK